MQFGVAAYTIVRDSETEVRDEIERITNVAAGSPGYEQLSRLDREHETRAAGHASGLLGFATAVSGPDSSARRSRLPSESAQFAEAGVDLLLLQCSPQLEEMERFAEEVISARV